METMSGNCGSSRSDNGDKIMAHIQYFDVDRKGDGH